MSTRNDGLEFARRVRQNLRFIEQAAGSHAGSDVHVVTQLTVSLLGIVVIPRERHLLDRVDQTPLDLLDADGWPEWRITLDEGSPRTSTLGDLLKHIRNAVAHGRIVFTSDSPRIEEVAILVEDKKRPQDPKPYWCAEIEASDLRDWCDRFLDFAVHNIGRSSSTT